MRRIVSWMLALVMCLSLSCPAMAAQNIFLSSALDSRGPLIQAADMNEEDVASCLVVTTIPEAREEKTDISQEDRDLLLEVYEKLSSGELKLPREEEYEILELVDVSWGEGACVEPAHDHEALLAQEDTAVSITFDLGDALDQPVVVMIYLNDAWVMADDVDNHGDGTVTVLAQDLCPMAFCVERGGDSSQTGGSGSGDSIFVPSIPYKDGPDIEEGEMDGEDVGDCLVISTITEAKEKTTDIYQEDRDLLLEVYEEISSGEMELPLEEDYVVRELVDVSWKKTTCVEEEHGHKEWLHEEDTTITITFDLGVGPDEDVIVLVYIDGEWVEAVSVINNGDGTVTVVFEDICPVAFCVEKRYIPPQTGDEAGNQLYFFAVLLGVSLVGLTGLLIWRKKRK